jgi:hypothetical protein
MLKVEATADLLTLVSCSAGEDAAAARVPSRLVLTSAGTLTGCGLDHNRLAESDLQRQEPLYASRDDFSTGLLDDFFSEESSSSSSSFVVGP